MLYECLKTDSPMVRVEAILGRETYYHLQPIEFEEGETHLGGFASLPSISKGNGDGIYLYVNRRFIKDRMIYKAVLEAYRHVIPAGKFPVVILFITLPPSSIDVNVHPTKAEVKFRDPDRIFRMVQGALSSALGSPDPLKRREEMGDATGQPPLKEFPALGSTKPSRPMSLPLVGEGRNAVPVVREAWMPEWEVERKTPVRILGQVQATYILCEGGEGLILIDQHAAHERLLYEKYKKDYEGGSIPAEKLLIPIPMELSTEESFVLMSYQEEVESMGFEIDAIGERMVAIRTLPKLTEPFDPKGMIRELLEELTFVKREGKGNEAIQRMLVSLACHSAIKANFVLRREEMEGLVGALHPFHSSLTCPHGRPVFFVLSTEELARQFKRKG
jgi:DNA mismatch repair protein MutL